MKGRESDMAAVNSLMTESNLITCKGDKLMNSTTQTTTQSRPQTRDIEQIKSYIANLQIKELSTPLSTMNLSLEQSDDTPASVVNSAIMIFNPGVSSQNQSDVKNSTLLAALAANYQFDPFKDTENWYLAYLEVLENLGWDKAPFNFTELSGGGGSFEVDKVILNLLQSIQGFDINAATELLKSLNNSDNDNALKLFDHTGSTSKQGNFQFGQVTQDSSGNVTLSVGAFFLTTKETIDKILWFKFSLSDTTFFQATNTLLLDEDVYSQVRKEVIKKLGDNAVKFVASIKLKTS